MSVKSTRGQWIIEYWLGAELEKCIISTIVVTEFVDGYVGH